MHLKVNTSLQSNLPAYFSILEYTMTNLKIRSILISDLELFLVKKMRPVPYTKGFLICGNLLNLFLSDLPYLLHH